MLLCCNPSCSKKENAPASTEASKAAQPAPEPKIPEAALVPPEAESAAAETSANPGTLVLPTTFKRRTGDLDEMLKERDLRALVIVNPISFFYVNGKPKGITYELVGELQRFINKKYKTGALKIKITYVPERPDQIGPVLLEGIGDCIAIGFSVTPAREEKFAFPTVTGVSHIIVTGAELSNVNSFDDLVGKDIYVNPWSVSLQNLKKINEERVKQGKAQLSVKTSDPNLMEDDLIEMVNAGLIPATVTNKFRAGLWQEALPNLRPHDGLVVANDGNLAWVLRKNNPELKKLLDEFVETHRQGTSVGNTLMRRYLQNTKWVKNSTSTEEMKKFATYIQYFQKYAGEYNFDYLMITAQSYQESLLDQSKRSHAGAVGLMQVIPKYAAAKPINVPDVSSADKNVLAGVRMLRNIADTYFNDPGIDQVNKTLFTFASYNAGPNRIVRLRKKAAAEGLDPNKWFGNVELEVAEDIGQETVTYVGNVYKYYIAYKMAAERAQEVERAKAATGAN
jgi:membrane-bound lytic murein transglycosylase MltF